MTNQEAINILENYAPGRDLSWSEMRDAIIVAIIALKAQDKLCECGDREKSLYYDEDRD